MATAKQLDDDKLRERIRALGLRVTGSRMAVLRCLIKAQTPMSHADVYERVQDTCNDRATVYRNLIDLAEVGLLRRTDIDHVWRFEWVGESKGEHNQNAHAHFVCTQCGTVTCLPEPVVSVRAAPSVPRAVRNKQVEVNLRGLCDGCEVGARR